MGLEALSRGAEFIEFIELNPKAATGITTNLGMLGAVNGRVHHQPANTWLEIQPPETVDILFLDPPFAKNLHNEIFEAINQAKIMKSGGLIYVESPKDELLILPENWQIEKDKTGGQVRYLLCKYTA